MLRCFSLSRNHATAIFKGFEQPFFCDKNIIMDMNGFVNVCVRKTAAAFFVGLACTHRLEEKRIDSKRNIDRFPEDFMFQLLKEEIPDSSKSQIVTLNESGNKRGRKQNR